MMKFLLKFSGYQSKKAVLVKNSQVLYEFITEQAERIEFYDGKCFALSYSFH
jgi:hypothetical protein